MKVWYTLIATIVCSILFCNSLLSQPIDRKSLVGRHKVVNDHVDPLSALSVGNGKFAFTVDVTGLQSFPEAYEKGVPLGTQSEWGWHSFIDAGHFTFSETLKNYQFNGKNVSYSVQFKGTERTKNAVEWFRQNPHRLQLGNIGLEIIKKDGTLATIEDIHQIPGVYPFRRANYDQIRAVRVCELRRNDAALTSVCPGPSHHDIVWP